MENAVQASGGHDDPAQIAETAGPAASSRGHDGTVCHRLQLTSQTQLSTDVRGRAGRTIPMTDAAAAPSQSPACGTPRRPSHVRILHPDLGKRLQFPHK